MLVPQTSSETFFGSVAPTLEGQVTGVFRNWILPMRNLDDRTAANLDVVLESVCRTLPNCGGDHETRKFIAKKMLQAVQRGRRTLGALDVVARRALQAL